VNGGAVKFVFLWSGEACGVSSRGELPSGVRSVWAGYCLKGDTSPFAGRNVSDLRLCEKSGKSGRFYGPFFVGVFEEVLGISFVLGLGGGADSSSCFWGCLSSVP